jgi:hypothetical protein
MKEEWTSLRAYARHRGCALSAVQKAIESRRVTAIREENGRITGIEKNAADLQWGLNTDPIEAERNGKLQTSPPAPASLPAQPAGEKCPGSTNPSAGDFLAARTKEAALRGQLLELDRLERMEELLPRSVVQREFSEIFSQLKTAVFHIPDRKAQALAAEMDPTRIHRLLSEELRMVFDEFSRRVASAAAVADNAGAAEEREPVLP